MTCPPENLERFWHDLRPVLQCHCPRVCCSCLGTVMSWAIATAIADTYGDDEAGALEHAQHIAAELPQLVRQRYAAQQRGGTA